MDPRIENVINTMTSTTLHVVSPFDNYYLSIVWIAGIASLLFYIIKKLLKK